MSLLFCHDYCYDSDPLSLSLLYIIVVITRLRLRIANCQYVVEQWSGELQKVWHTQKNSGVDVLHWKTIRQKATQIRLRCAEMHRTLPIRPQQASTLSQNRALKGF